MRLIDADKLTELCDIMSDKCDGIGTSVWNQFRTTVEWSPTVDAVPVVHGEWLPHVNQMNDDDWACSNCGMYFCFEAGNPIANETYYCPYCGAKMDGGC